MMHALRVMKHRLVPFMMSVLLAGGLATLVSPLGGTHQVEAVTTKTPILHMELNDTDSHIVFIQPLSR